MDFVVIDVETANPDVSSICQVGIASFRDGQLADAWVSLVNPKKPFNRFNVAIHGIEENHVRSAPTWAEVFPQIDARLRGHIVVSHTPFDKRALAGACARLDMAEVECDWLDSARVVRMAWPQFAKAGYGLPNVAAHFGIQYLAHDALEDARCAGLLLLRAMAETGLSPREWLVRVAHPIEAVERAQPKDKWPTPCKREGAVGGKLFGEVLVFTGTMGISRDEAADAAAAVGCRVDDGVTRHTTMLVVGGWELRVTGGYKKSAKQLKAERLVGRGQRIRILRESDFLRTLAKCEAPRAV